MATRETPFQRELISDAALLGFHAFKASNQYSTGVVDLYVRCRQGGVWAECKFIKPVGSFRTEKVSMTRPQWSFMDKEWKAGGMTSLIIGYKQSGIIGNEHGLFICDPRHQDQQVKRNWFEDLDHPDHVVKVPGKPWDVQRIFRRIFAREGFCWID